MIGEVTVGVVEGGMRDIEVDYFAQEVGRVVGGEGGVGVLAVAEAEEERVADGWRGLGGGGGELNVVEEEEFGAEEVRGEGAEVLVDDALGVPVAGVHGEGALADVLG